MSVQSALTSSNPRGDPTPTYYRNIPKGIVKVYMFVTYARSWLAGWPLDGQTAYKDVRREQEKSQSHIETETAQKHLNTPLWPPLNEKNFSDTKAVPTDTQNSEVDHKIIMNQNTRVSLVESPISPRSAPRETAGTAERRHSRPQQTAFSCPTERIERNRDLNSHKLNFRVDNLNSGSRKSPKPGRLKIWKNTREVNSMSSEQTPMVSDDFFSNS